MRIHRKMFLAVIPAIALLLAACVPSTPGMVGNTDRCTTPIVNGRITISPFIGHNVVASYAWCHSFTGIHYVSTPAVSTPTSWFGGGALESVSIARVPYLSYLSTYHVESTFDVKQQIAHVLGSQTFKVTMRWDTSSGRTQMCFHSTRTRCASGP
jgi:hypothetical protein